MVKTKFILKLLIGLVILPSALIGTLFYFEKNGFFNIDNIQVVVENSVDQSVYLQPLVKNLDAQLEFLRGVSLWRVNLPELNSNLTQLSWIEDLSLSRRWPSQLRVNVRAKEVNLLLMTRSGRFVPIVESGESLPPVDLKQLPDVAVLRGENFEARSELRKKAVKMLKEIPSSGAFSKKTISEIHFDERDGFWMTLVRDGIRVKMGQEQISLKSARVGQVIEYIDSRKLDVRVIDANLSKKVLVRLRKEP